MLRVWILQDCLFCEDSVRFAVKLCCRIFRYRMLSAETWPRWTGDPREGAVCILRSIYHLQQLTDDKEIALGTTKIFLNDPKTVSFRATRPL